MFFFWYFSEFFDLVLVFEIVLSFETFMVIISFFLEGDLFQVLPLSRSSFLAHGGDLILLWSSYCPTLLFRWLPFIYLFIVYLFILPAVYTSGYSVHLCASFHRATSSPSGWMLGDVLFSYLRAVGCLNSSISKVKWLSWTLSVIGSNLYGE